MAYISKITDLDGSTYDLKSKVTNGILYGEVDSTSTATAFTAQIPGITEYYDGLTILLRNGIVTSASGFTININGLGGKPSYSNMTLGNDITPTSPTRDTTIFNINYAMIFVYNTTVVSTGCWICYRGYDANTNTLGYQLRTNSYILKTISRTRYYRILFTSADNTHWVPANTTYDNSATSVKTPNPVPINPFGEIVYLGNSTSYVAEADVAATAIWQQYTFALGYSFNTTGAALTLTTRKPVYVKCAPQSDGSAIIDSTTPYVQELPSTDDGKIYILLGMAYSATNIELLMNHPVYYYKDGAVRLWTNSAAQSITVEPHRSTGKNLVTINDNVVPAYDELVIDLGQITDTTEGVVSQISLGSSEYYTSIVGGLLGKQNIFVKGSIALPSNIVLKFRINYIDLLPMGEDPPMYVFGGVSACIGIDELEFYDVFVGIPGNTASLIYKKHGEDYRDVIIDENRSYILGADNTTITNMISQSPFRVIVGATTMQYLFDHIASGYASGDQLYKLSNTRVRLNNSVDAILNVKDVYSYEDPTGGETFYLADYSIYGVFQLAGSVYNVYGELAEYDDNPYSGHTSSDFKSESWYINDEYDTYDTGDPSSQPHGGVLTLYFEKNQPTIDSHVSSDSDNLVTSSGIYDAIEDAQLSLLESAATQIGLTLDSSTNTVSVNNGFNYIMACISTQQKVLFRMQVGYTFKVFEVYYADVSLHYIDLASVGEDSISYIHLVPDGTTAMTGQLITTSIPTATSDLTNDSGFITNSAISNMQTTGNLVTSMSSSSTDTQYPSAKLMYDTVGNLESLLAAI